MCYLCDSVYSLCILLCIASVLCILLFLLFALHVVGRQLWRNKPSYINKGSHSRNFSGKSQEDFLS